MPAQQPHVYKKYTMEHTVPSAKSCYNMPMQKKKIIIGNWKMNPNSFKEAQNNFIQIKKEASKFKSVQTVIAAPFVYLSSLGKLASAALMLSAQNISAEKEG